MGNEMAYLRLPRGEIEREGEKEKAGVRGKTKRVGKSVRQHQKETLFLSLFLHFVCPTQNELSSCSASLSIIKKKKVEQFISRRFWVQRRVRGKEKEGRRCWKEKQRCALDSGHPFPLELWRKAGQAEKGGDRIRLIQTAIWETGAMAYETHCVSVHVCVVLDHATLTMNILNS